jgi:hypothetical protein
MPDLTAIVQLGQGVSKKRLDFMVQRPKLCSAVTITGCGVTVRLLGVSSLNLGCGQTAAHFFAGPKQPNRVCDQNRSMHGLMSGCPAISR